MSLEDSIISGTMQILNQANQDLQNLSIHIPNATLSLLEKQHAALELYKVRLQHAVKNRLNEAEAQLKEKEAFIKLSSPEYILAKGYSITIKDGKTVKNATDLKHGDRISTKLSKGEIQSTVEFSPAPRISTLRI